VSPALIAALFGAGVASSLAPCVLPLVPAYIGMVVGVEAQGSRSPLAPTCAFVAGVAAVFASLGVIAGLVGVAVAPTQLWLQRVGGALVVIFGVSLLTGLPRMFSGTWRPFAAHVRRAPVMVAPFIIGIAFGAAWTPCVGPLLGAALVLAADQASAAKGGVLLFVYALGVGVPFLVTSLALASAPGLRRRLEVLAPAIQRGAGLALAGVGVLLATGLYGHFTSALARFNPLPS
jgi:cytochrome c-type biogenesis protein